MPGVDAESVPRAVRSRPQESDEEVPSAAHALGTHGRMREEILAMSTDRAYLWILQPLVDTGLIHQEIKI